MTDVSTSKPGARRRDRWRARVPRLSTFALEHLLLLPIGASIALIWANVALESYYTFTYAISFIVNDVAMVFFFALIVKEVVEATAPGGVLHPWRRGLLPVIASLGAAIVPIVIYIYAVDFLDEPVLAIAWPVLFAIDVAVSYFVARIIYRPHPIVPFLILLSISSNALGVIALAIAGASREMHLAVGALLLAAAIAVAMGLRKARVKSFWPYVAAAGGLSWFAFHWSGLHPALALVPIMPFLPHSARDPGFFVDAEPGMKDTLSQFELVFRYPSQIALFFFGLVNAGVPLRALEEGTYGLPIAVLVGRPIGLLLGAGVAMAVGLHLPHRMGWRDLVVAGFAASIGFSIGLFFASALLPPGQLVAETRMGVILASIVGLPLAIVAALVLRTGRFGSTAVEP